MFRQLICVFIGSHNWTYHSVVTNDFTDRWLSCDRCEYVANFPRESHIKIPKRRSDEEWETAFNETLKRLKG